MDKVVRTAAEAVADIPRGASLAVGGFGINGIPHSLIEAIHNQGATDLEVVSNNLGIDGWGLGVLLDAKRIARTTNSGFVSVEAARRTRGFTISATGTPLGTRSSFPTASAMNSGRGWPPAISVW